MNLFVDKMTAITYLTQRGWTMRYWGDEGFLGRIKSFSWVPPGTGSREVPFQITSTEAEAINYLVLNHKHYGIDTRY